MVIEEEIRQFIVGNFMTGLNPRTLRDKDSLLENGVIDSTGVLELVGFLEEKYEISVADEELVPENLDSISNAAAYIRKKRAAMREPIRSQAAQEIHGVAQPHESR
jgi:acyl carrier protein